MNSTNGFMKTIGKIEKSTVVRAIRGGLIHIIPVLIIGAFSLILQTFPVEAYKNFISGFADGLYSDCSR